MSRNYRGRYEDDGDIDMVANRSKTMFSYNKFWVAIVGFALTAVTGFTGVDFTMFGITPEAVIGLLTAIGVFAIPNVR